MIPDRVDKNQLLFDNAKRYQTLSKNRNSPFFMNRSSGPKVINKNLSTASTVWVVLSFMFSSSNYNSKECKPVSLIALIRITIWYLLNCHITNDLETISDKKGT